MLEFIDQMNRKVELPHLPKRIVSLVPSQTELLYHWKLKYRLVGQTIFCIKPEKEFDKAVKVGGTKKLQLDKIRALKPDLIIGNKEENEQSQIEALAEEFPVWMSDINSIEEALDMFVKLGVVLGRMEKAAKLDHQVRLGLSQLKPVHKSAVYLIWQNPFMAVSENTFINDVMKKAGITNLVKNTSSRYPEISPEEIRALKPDLLLLSSEPYPFKDSHQKELTELFPETEVKLVDGEIFSWYGSRMLEIESYFKSF